MKRIATTLLMLAMALCAAAQQYNGTSGMIHVPTAEMNAEGTAQIGAHLINKQMMPDTGFLYEGHKYHSLSYYMDITPFQWIELAFTCTERKTRGDGDFGGYGRKDRYISVKVRPVKEGRYHPAVAIGMNDVGTTIDESATRTDVQFYFRNVYIAATKHFYLYDNQIEANLAFRHFARHYNDKWNGLVGGLAVRPKFCPQARAMIEYTGNEVIVGADVLLWRHLLLQAGLKDFRHPSFGICYRTNLFGNNTH